MSELPEQLHEVLQQAICQGQDEGSILTGCTLSFEIMTQEGRPMAGYFMGPSTSPWKALGMMRWAEKLVEFKHIRE